MRGVARDSVKRQNVNELVQETENADGHSTGEKETTIIDTTGATT